MPYQPYYPGGWQPGPSGNTPISHDALNRMEQQYAAVKAELASPGGDLTVHVANVVGAARVAQIDIFTVSGTWTKPAGAKLIYVEVLSGGGGGYANSNTGGGGGGGGRVCRLIPADDVPSMVPVTVGAGGAGGTTGIGSDGGNSSFGSLVVSVGGERGGNNAGGHGGGLRPIRNAFATPRIEGTGFVGGLGGVDVSGLNNGMPAEFGGGGGGRTGHGGSSLWGGGGGAGASAGNQGGATGVFTYGGGSGQDGVFPFAGQGGRVGQNGGVPAGGGGATPSGGGPAGSGARGEVRVYTFF